MKRILTLTVTSVMLFSLITACSSGANNNTAITAATTGTNTVNESSQVSPESSEVAVIVSEYGYTLNGIKIKPNDNFSDIVDSLGEADDYFESESCAFQGLDKVYTYGSVTIKTYPKDDIDYILSVEFKDDITKTDEGISIGSTSEEITAIYGESYVSNGSSITYTDGNTNLNFILTDGKVSYITYTRVE